MKVVANTAIGRSFELIKSVFQRKSDMPSASVRDADRLDGLHASDLALRTHAHTNVADLPASVLTEGNRMIDIHPEAGHNFCPDLSNSLAGLYNRLGGACEAWEYGDLVDGVMTAKDYGPEDIPDFTLVDMAAHKTGRAINPLPESLFDATTSYCSGLTKGDGTKYFVYDITPPTGQLLNYTINFFWHFGSTSWVPNYAEVLTLREGQTAFERLVQQKKAGTERVQPIWYGRTIREAAVITLRLVMVQPSNMRFSRFGAIQYNGHGLADQWMSRCNDDFVYRHISPATNNKFTLGQAGAQWKEVWARNLRAKMPDSTLLNIIPAPTYAYNYLGVQSSAPIETYLTAYIKRVCRDYPNTANAEFVGRCQPNNNSLLLLFIYDTAATNTDGMPRHALFQYSDINGRSYTGRVYEYVLSVYEGGNGSRDEINRKLTYLDSATTTPQDSCVVLTGSSGGGADEFIKRPISALWTYMKGKADITYASALIDKISRIEGDIVDADRIIVGHETGYVQRTAQKLWDYVKGKSMLMFAGLIHTHTKSQITDFAHSHQCDDIDVHGEALDVVLEGKAAANHTHPLKTIDGYSIEGRGNIQTGERRFTGVNSVVGTPVQPVWGEDMYITSAVYNLTIASPAAPTIAQAGKRTRILFHTTGTPTITYPSTWKWAGDNVTPLWTGGKCYEIELSWEPLTLGILAKVTNYGDYPATTQVQTTLTISASPVTSEITFNGIQRPTSGDLTHVQATYTVTQGTQVQWRVSAVGYSSQHGTWDGGTTQLISVTLKPISDIDRPVVYGGDEVQP